MKNYRLITPEGTKDYLFEEAVLRKKTEEKLRDAFQYRGYHEVVTPSVEFLDVFNTRNNSVLVEEMYKLVDSKGRLMVLRPDSTMPIARLCATRLKNEQLPLRLYYNQSVFSNNPSLKGRSNERMQAGIELIGASSLKSDIEALVTAVKALENLQIDHYRIEIGHIGIFNSLISSLNVEDEVKESIRQLIEEKNYPALNDRLDNLENKEVASVIKMLPRLFGGVNVFSRARAYIKDAVTLEIVTYLEKLYHFLSELGLEEKLTVDFGIVNRNDYYTGVVFKGYVEGYGEEVLTGGRYDSLLKEFGADCGAIGFAVNIDSAVKALLATKTQANAVVEVLIFTEEKNQMKALEYCNRLAELKIVTEYALVQTAEEALSYAKAKGITRLDVVAENEVKTIHI